MKRPNDSKEIEINHKKSRVQESKIPLNNKGHKDDSEVEREVRGWALLTLDERAAFYIKKRSKLYLELVDAALKVINTECTLWKKSGQRAPLPGEDQERINQYTQLRELDFKNSEKARIGFKPILAERAELLLGLTPDLQGEAKGNSEARDGIPLSINERAYLYLKKRAFLYLEIYRIDLEEIKREAAFQPEEAPLKEVCQKRLQQYIELAVLHFEDYNKAKADIESILAARIKWLGERNVQGLLPSANGFFSFKTSSKGNQADAQNQVCYSSNELKPLG